MLSAARRNAAHSKFVAILWCVACAKVTGLDDYRIDSATPSAASGRAGAEAIAGETHTRSGASGLGGAAGNAGFNITAGTAGTETAGGGAAGDEASCDAGECAGASQLTGIQFTGDEQTTYHGGNGGDEIIERCPEGQAIIGYTIGKEPVDTTIIVGRLQAHCGLLAIAGNGSSVPYRIVVQPGETLPMRGNYGADIAVHHCPVDHVVVGFNGRASRLLAQLAIVCAPLVVTPNSGGYSLAIGEKGQLPPVGGGDADPFMSPCPDEYVSVGQLTRSGAYIDGLALKCSKPNAVVSSANGP